MSSLAQPRKVITSLLSSLSTQPTPSSNHPQTANPLLNASPDIQKALLTLHILFPNNLLPALDLLDRNLLTRLVLKEPNENEQNEAPQQHHDTHSQHPHHLQPHAPQHPTIENTSHRPPRSAQDSLLHPSKTNSNLEAPPPRGPSGQPPHHLSPARRKETVVWRCRSSRGAEGSSGAASAGGRGRYAEGWAGSVREYEVRLQAWSCSCPAFGFAAFPAAAAADREEGERDGGHWGFERGGWSFGGLTGGGDVPPVCKHILACVLAEYCPVFAGMAEEREVSVEEVAGLAAEWAD